MNAAAPRRAPAALLAAALTAGLLAASILAACSGPSPLDAPDAGRTTAYEPGLPSFDLEAVATLRDGAPGLDVLLGLPTASLVFTRDAVGFVARYERTVQVRDERGRDVVAVRAVADTLRVASFEATRSPAARVARERIPLAPGRYVVVAFVEDAASGRRAERRQRVDVPAPTGAPALTRPLLAVHRPGDPAAGETGGGAGDAEADGFAPLLALGTTAGFDTLRTAVELYNAPSGAAVRFVLTRLRADTSVAAPPYWLGPPRGSLAFRGVDVAGAPADTVQQTTRTLDQPAEAVRVEVDAPGLPEGLYRVAVEARLPDGAPFGTAERVFAVRRPGFPYLRTSDDLLAPLAYLTTERELAALRGGATPDERRRRFDAFWGGLLEDRQTAGGALRTYFERVEQANLLFTTAKEGWMTDRGMLYVLFGPPEFVETAPDTETWHYRYGSRDALAVFVFERGSFLYPEVPVGFEGAVLQRSPVYEAPWRRLVERWRRGEVR